MVRLCFMAQPHSYTPPQISDEGEGPLLCPITSYIYTGIQNRAKFHSILNLYTTLHFSNNISFLSFLTWESYSLGSELFN